MATRVFALKETVSSAERSFLSLIFPSHGEEAGGRAGRTRETRRAGTAGMTVVQGAVASAPTPLRAGLVLKAARERNPLNARAREAELTPEVRSPNAPGRGKGAPHNPGLCSTPSPCPPPRAKKKKPRRDEPDASRGCPVAPKSRLPPRRRAVLGPPLCQGPRGRAGLREPGPVRGDLALRGERLEAGRREKSHREDNRNVAPKFAGNVSPKANFKSD